MMMKGSMKMKKKICLFLTIFALVASISPSSVLAGDAAAPQIKNIIYFIPDGGGYALFDFANGVKNSGGFNSGFGSPYKTAVEANDMTMKQYLRGSVTTYCSNSAITDSAAAGTALSSGYKTNSGFVGLTPDGEPRANIAETAQMAGKRTGLVPTVQFTHATPAAFGAHHPTRYGEAVMAQQMINQGFDVVLPFDFSRSDWGSSSEATKRGYKLINTKDDLTSVKSGDKIWGNMNDYDTDVWRREKEPKLAEMTDAAIRALDGGEEGFFLMVEGSSVDGGGHQNDLVLATSEYLAMDAAFKVAVDYAKTRTDTVVIAVPDHDTGGCILPGEADSVGGQPDYTQYANAIAKVQNGVSSNLPDISWTGTGHTARNVGFWAYLPEGINPPAGMAAVAGDTPQTRALTADNTVIALWLSELAGLDLNKATEKLFVDVTDMGTYKNSTNEFSFNDYDVKIKTNTSTAIINGEEVDLNGEIAIKPYNKFYVPRRLLDEIKPLIRKVKDARYFDSATNKILIKGQIDEAFAGSDISLILVSKTNEDDVGFIDEIPVLKDGSYVCKFKFKGNINDYELKMRLGDRIVTDSIISATTNYSWLDSAVEIARDGEIIKSDIIINNYYDMTGLTYRILLMFYDDSGKLVGCSFSDNLNPVDGAVSYDSLNVERPENATRVKATVWADLIMPIPLSDAAVMSIN